MYISKDEPVAEVGAEYVYLSLRSVTSQFHKINEVLAKKPFADKNDAKIYGTM
jgi:hypothetical protein